MREGQAQSHLMMLFRDWDHAWTMAGEVKSEEESERWTETYGRIMREMMEIPSSTAADFAAKVIAHTGYGCFSIERHCGGAALLEEAVSLTGANGDIEFPNG